jgi:hypothetical protein
MQNLPKILEKKVKGITKSTNLLRRITGQGEAMNDRLDAIKELIEAREKKEGTSLVLERLILEELQMLREGYDESKKLKRAVQEVFWGQ